MPRRQEIAKRPKPSLRKRLTRAAKLGLAAAVLGTAGTPERARAQSPDSPYYELYMKGVLNADDLSALDFGAGGEKAREAARSKIEAYGAGQEYEAGRQQYRQQTTLPVTPKRRFSTPPTYTKPPAVLSWSDSLYYGHGKCQHGVPPYTHAAIQEHFENEPEHPRNIELARRVGNLGPEHVKQINLVASHFPTNGFQLVAITHALGNLLSEYRPGTPIHEVHRRARQVVLVTSAEKIVDREAAKHDLGGADKALQRVKDHMKETGVLPDSIAVGGRKISLKEAETHPDVKTLDMFKTALPDHGAGLLKALAKRPE